MSKGSEPAFPAYQELVNLGSGGSRLDTKLFPAGGLTKREYFAAMAMQGLLSNADLTRFDREDAQLSHQQVLNAVSSASARYADALLAELDKKE